jgi:CobQ-like glutamine amidotransferase family enzyme
MECYTGPQILMDSFEQSRQRKMDNIYNLDLVAAEEVRWVGVVVSQQTLGNKVGGCGLDSSGSG